MRKIDQDSNAKDSISNLINENKQSLKEFEDWKQNTNQKKEDEACSQISSIAEDLSELKQVVENQSQKDILAAQNLRDKRNETENRPNKTNIEEESKMVQPAFKENPSVQDPPLIQSYQGNTMTHHQQISLYNLINQDDRYTTLLIYDTEIETKQEKIIQTPETLDCYSSIAQLPSGRLFFYGNSSYSGATLIIDESGGVQVLPSGTPCYVSSGIYFNDNVYCFGGYNDGKPLSLSSRFDLDRNKWVKLAPLQKADGYCNSIIFRGNILISGRINTNLVRYSIGRNTFTTIPYQFAKNRRKILINGERLYLIECVNGSIYESKIGSDTDWRRIGHSGISFIPIQTYCSYNQGEVYIGCSSQSVYYCFRFNFARKILMKIT